MKSMLGIKGQATGASELSLNVVNPGEPCRLYLVTLNFIAWLYDASEEEEDEREHISESCFRGCRCHA